jgi:hypothetical protein
MKHQAASLAAVLSKDYMVRTVHVGWDSLRQFYQQKGGHQMCTYHCLLGRQGGTSKKTTFDPAPIYRDREPTLEGLVHDCEPATVGFNGEDVLDEAVAVRKAGKLEAYKFSTNLHPCDYRIVDTVAQQLLPGIMRVGRQPAVDRWGVVAELYKLNVYSGPSGMFKPHIDAPRGRT